jgi:O-antigen ligase
MVLSLPSLEAPKNIFLVLFVIVAILRQVKTTSLRVWGSWDWMFLALIASAFLSTVFAGLSPGDEWKGFRVLLTFIGVGWLISRSGYSSKELSLVFWTLVFSTLPPLFWALWQRLIIYSMETLELHSVGHANHSAIYLTMIFAASLGASLSLWRSASFPRKIILIFLPILFYLSLIIGQSRAAFGVGTLIGVFLSFLITRDKKEMMSVLGIILTLFVIIISSNAPIVKKQVDNQKNHDVLAGRGVIWNVTIEAARLYPFFGIGIDNRAVVTKDEIKNSVESRHEIFDEKLYDFHFKHSHNFYLTNIAEHGLVGAAVTLFFIFMWFWYLVKTFYLTKLSTQAAYLWAGSMGAWMTTFGVGFVNTTFHHEQGILACLFLGLHLTFLNTYKYKIKSKRNF